MTPADVEVLRKNVPATAVLSLQHPECHGAFGIKDDDIAAAWKEYDVTYVRVPMRDFDEQSQMKNLPYAVRALADLLADNHTVYVHCTAGINRSTLVVLAYLVFFEDFTDQQALAFLKEKREGAYPYMEVFWAFRTEFVMRHHQNITKAAYLNYLNGGADEFHNWIRAEREAIRKCILGDKYSS